MKVGNFIRVRSDWRSAVIVDILPPSDCIDRKNVLIMYTDSKGGSACVSPNQFYVQRAPDT